MLLVCFAIVKLYLRKIAFVFSRFSNASNILLIRRFSLVFHPDFISSTLFPNQVRFLQPPVFFRFTLVGFVHKTGFVKSED